MRRLELRRHAPRGPVEDKLSSDGELLAEEIGRTLEGPYDLIVTSPKRRAAETVAWFLRGAKHPLPPAHGVAEGLAPGEPGASYGEAVRAILADIPEGGRGLAVGHTPMLEQAVEELTGVAVAPFRECEGALLVEDGGEIRLERELRRR